MPTEQVPSWPTMAEKAFVEAHPLYGAAVAERTDERLWRMINGFREAADLLVEQSEAEPHLRQDFVYPVVFMYRHSIELELKYLLMAYGPLANEAPDFSGHDLPNLWSRCKRVLAYFDSKPGIRVSQTVQSVDRHIAAFDVIDNRSDAWRFAHDRKGQPISLPMETVDLPNLRKVASGIHDFLECIDWQFCYGYRLAPCPH